MFILYIIPEIYGRRQGDGSRVYSVVDEPEVRVYCQVLDQDRICVRKRRSAGRKEPAELFIKAACFVEWTPAKVLISTLCPGVLKGRKVDGGSGWSIRLRASAFLRRRVSAERRGCFSLRVGRHPGPGGGPRMGHFPGGHGGRTWPYLKIGIWHTMEAGPLSAHHIFMSCATGRSWQYGRRFRYLQTLRQCSSQKTFFYS